MRYTIVHRKPCERRCYSFGYYSCDLEMLKEIAQKDAESKEYSCVKIIDADTNLDVEYFTKAHR